jgi:hypothetical protein
MFIIFYKNNYLFVLLKYLLPVSEIKYLVLKNIFKKYHANIGKCGNVVIRKTTVQPKLIWMLGLGPVWYGCGAELHQL